jgi:hypothetical protein
MELDLSIDEGIVLLQQQKVGPLTPSEVKATAFIEKFTNFHD